eukprot:6195601-Pleurochrysis_carterae.AAC.1
MVVAGGAVVAGGGLGAGGGVRGDDASEKKVHVRWIGRVLSGCPSIHYFLTSCHADVSGVLAAEVR